MIKQTDMLEILFIKKMSSNDTMTWNRLLGGSLPLWKLPIMLYLHIMYFICSKLYGDNGHVGFAWIPGSAIWN